MNEITAITPQTKDKTRCNIFINGKFYCGLSLETAVKNRLKVGQRVSPSYLAKLQMECEKQKALDKALTHVSVSRKTEKQVREFLRKKGYLSIVCDYVIEKMRDYNFVNDVDYAQAYVDSAVKKKGGRLIRLELKRKGVAEEDVDCALESVDAQTEIDTATGILQKYMRGKVADKETLHKAFRYLMGKGFDYEIVKSALSAFGDLDEE